MLDHSLLISKCIELLPTAMLLLLLFHYVEMLWINYQTVLSMDRVIAVYIAHLTIKYHHDNINRHLELWGKMSFQLEQCLAKRARHGHHLTTWHQNNFDCKQHKQRSPLHSFFASSDSLFSCLQHLNMFL